MTRFIILVGAHRALTITPFMFNPMSLLARTLQIIGILEMGYGLFVGVFQDLQTGQGGLALDLRFAAVGGACFLAGWLIQRWKGR